MDCILDIIVICALFFCLFSSTVYRVRVIVLVCWSSVESSSECSPLGRVFIWSLSLSGAQIQTHEWTDRSNARMWIGWSDQNIGRHWTERCSREEELQCQLAHQAAHDQPWCDSALKITPYIYVRGLWWEWERGPQHMGMRDPWAMDHITSMCVWCAEESEPQNDAPKGNADTRYRVHQSVLKKEKK